MSKTVILNLSTGRRVNLNGSDSDRSIIGAIEHSNGHYEKNVMAILPEIIKQNFICLDVGANIGALSLAFADLAVKGKVVSIEAGKNNFDYLCANINENKFLNITPINTAVSDYIGTATFNYVEEVAGCSFISTTGVRAGKQETVKMTTIDSLVNDLQLDHVDFMKIDVEGGERKALWGAKETLKRFSPVLLIEWNPNTIGRFYGEDPFDLFKLIAATWKTIELIREDERIFVHSYEELCLITDAGKGWEDLLCRP